MHGADGRTHGTDGAHGACGRFPSPCQGEGSRVRVPSSAPAQRQFSVPLNHVVCPPRPRQRMGTAAGPSGGHEVIDSQRIKDRRGVLGRFGHRATGLRRRLSVAGTGVGDDAASCVVDGSCASPACVPMCSTTVGVFVVALELTPARQTMITDPPALPTFAS